MPSGYPRLEIERSERVNFENGEMVLSNRIERHDGYIQGVLFEIGKELDAAAHKQPDENGTCHDGMSEIKRNDQIDGAKDQGERLYRSIDQMIREERFASPCPPAEDKAKIGAPTVSAPA